MPEQNPALKSPVVQVAEGNVGLEPKVAIKRGRKPVHASPAARAAFYRANKAKKIAEAFAKAAKVDLVSAATVDTAELETLKQQLASSATACSAFETELNTLKRQLATAQELQKLAEAALRAERDLGRQQALHIVTLQNTKASKSKVQRVDSGKRLMALRKHFVDGFRPRPDDAKRLRTNSKKAANAATEILNALKGLDLEAREAVAGDIDALQAAVELLQDYGSSLEVTQRNAESAAKAREALKKKEHDELVAKTIIELLRNVATREEDGRLMAEDLVTYDRVGVEWLKRVKHVVNGYPRIGNDYRIRQALRSGDIKIVLAEVAECRIDIGLHGRKMLDSHGRC